MKRIFWIIFFGSLLLFLMVPYALSNGKWESGKSRYSSDIYIAGSLVGAKGEDTIYSWDIKLAYPRLFNKNLGGGTRWLSLSPLVEFVANEGTDSNPDRGKIAGQVSYIFDPMNGQRTIIETQWLTDIGAEFDRDIDTHNFNVSTFLRLLFKTFGRNGYAFVPEVEFGAELGRNFRNKISENGSGNFARIYIGFNIYQELGSENIVLLANYQYRGLLRDEIFGEKIEEEVVRALTKKARHYVEVGISIPIGSLFSITSKFKRGSLPPAFTFVNNQFSISLEFNAVRN
jgi:hypothetical protein